MSNTGTTSPPSLSRIVRWLARYVARQWTGLLVVLVTMLLKITMDVLKPWPMKLLVDHALDDQPLPAWLQRLVQFTGPDVSAQKLVTVAAIAMVGVFLLAWCLSATLAATNVWLGQRLVYDLAADLFGHLQRLSLRFHHRKPVGDSIRRVTSDSNCISAIVKDAMMPIVTSLVTLVVMFTILWRLNTTLTLVSLIVVPLMALVLRRYAQPMVQASYRQQEAEGRMYAVVEHTLTAMPVVQAFTREQLADEQFHSGTQASLHATLETTTLQLKFRVLIGLASAIGTAAIMLIGGREVLEGRLTLGGLLVFLAYLASLYAPLEALTYTGSAFQGAAGSARRALEVLDHEPEVKEKSGAISLDSLRGDVVFDSVTFGYESGRPVLDNVSLHVSAGETIAIVGPTGAGKTTLVGLILRSFDPWQGAVTLDSHDLRDLTLASLRKHVAIVLQDPFLFPMTIAQNVSYGRPTATRQEIIQAAVAANAHDFVEKLEMGYDTVIGERGATLSGGERQRLAIARALLKNAPLLILDEPTASLDAQTESLMMQALNRLMHGRTTFIIAHRLSTIRSASRILVLDRGKVAEIGTHDQLLARNGLYAQLYRTQFGNAANADFAGES